MTNERRPLPRRGLYALIDTVTLRRAGLEPVAFAEAVIAGRPRLLQLRAKDLESGDHLALLRALVPLSRAAGVPLFANDRPDLAELAGCDGVHVGQEDLPLAEVRRIAPGLLVGISTHRAAQVDAALALSPDYLAFGPVFATASKENADPVVGLEALGEVVRRAACPVVGIGGISLDHAADVATMGALGAVIGALIPPGGSLDEVTRRVKDLERVLSGP